MKHQYPAPTLVRPSMTALSVKEPWAGMIRAGRKTIEVRSWATKYRGPLLICASASPKTLYSGHAVAIANLVECRPVTPKDSRAAGFRVLDGWAWILRDIEAITPYPVKGKLGLFKAPRP